MFSNFKDTFIKKPQYTSEPPQAVIASISQELPDGFYYVHDHDGYCRIEAPEGLNIQSGKVHLSDEDRACLPNNCTMNDVLKYSYNAQREVVLSPNDDGCFIINGEHVRAIDFVKTPMRNMTFIDAQLRVVPAKFPAPFDLEVSSDGYTETLHIKRVPNRSLNVEKYESDGSTVISVWFTIDPTSSTPFTFNITVNMKKAKAVKDAIAAYHIYNAFADGKGYIGGNPLSIKDHTPFEKVPIEVIRLAEKLLQLEEHLDVHFDFSKGVTIADAKTADELYRSIIEKKPFKRFKTFDTLSGKGHFITASKQKEYVNTAIAFEFSGSKHISLLNANFTCRALSCIFNAVIASFSADGDEETGDFVIHLTTAPGEKMYESVQYFMSEDQLDMFRENKDHITVLREATEISALE